MGLLDDAIKEHLDLKRRRGADPAEVERAEREALGPVRRAPTAHEADVTGESPTESDFAYDHEGDSWDDDSSEQASVRGEHSVHGDQAPEPDFGDQRQREREPRRPSRPSRLARIFGKPDHEPEPDREPEPELEYEAAEQHEAESHELEVDEPAPPGRGAPAEAPSDLLDEPEPPQAPEAAGAGLGDETEVYEVEPGPGAGESEPTPDQADEDVLEETPEFLQDTPDHDRLWFEQRPPRDFDFDG
jgi:hypothetical protein